MNARQTPSMEQLCELASYGDFEQADAYLTSVLLDAQEIKRVQLDPEHFAYRDHSCGWTLLHHAARYNQKSIVTMLLTLGANPLITCGRGREYFFSPIGTSAYYASPDALKAFIDFGCDYFLKAPHLHNKPGSTLLHRIMNRFPKGGHLVEDQKGVIQVLVELYPDPFCADENGQSPLEHANTPEKKNWFMEAFALRERKELHKIVQSAQIAKPRPKKRM